MLFLKSRPPRPLPCAAVGQSGRAGLPTRKKPAQRAAASFRQDVQPSSHMGDEEQSAKKG